MSRRPHGIIPDIVLKKIEENAPTIEQRNRARRSLALSQAMRARRAEAVEPGEGEQRTVYDSQNTSDKGDVARAEDGPEAGDEAVDTLYDDTGRWYGILFREFSRRSFDGHGAPLYVVANYEKDFDNAFWDSWGIWIGGGFFFRPFHLAKTVTFHEWTHALTEKTLNLQYLRQWGALNEFISDAWGAAIEQAMLGQSAESADWLIGRELFGGQVKGGRALRDMLNPGTAYDDPLIGRDPQPAHMRDYYHGSQDNYGVHINSGIPNRAFALASRRVGGMVVDTVLPPLADVMFNRAVGPQATFQEMANAMFAAAINRFGSDGAVTEAVAYGWGEVGIEVGNAPVPVPEPPPPSPCELTDAEVVALARIPGIGDLAPALRGITQMSDAEILVAFRNPTVVEAALAVAAMPQARRLMAVARKNIRT